MLKTLCFSTLIFFSAKLVLAGEIVINGEILIPAIPVEPDDRKLAELKEKYYFSPSEFCTSEWLPSKDLVTKSPILICLSREQGRCTEYKRVWFQPDPKEVAKTTLIDYQNYFEPCL